MSDTQTPVADVVTEVSQDVKEAVKSERSAAQDLRDIQNLLVMGIYPGNMAPSVVKAYELLERMAVKVETDAKNEAEFKARQTL